MKDLEQRELRLTGVMFLADTLAGWPSICTRVRSVGTAIGIALTIFAFPGAKGALGHLPSYHRLAGIYDWTFEALHVPKDAPLAMIWPVAALDGWLLSSECRTWITRIGGSQAFAENQGGSQDGLPPTDSRPRRLWCRRNRILKNHEIIQTLPLRASDPS